MEWLQTTNEDRSFITVDCNTEKIVFKQIEIAEIHKEISKECEYKFGFI